MRTILTIEILLPIALLLLQTLLLLFICVVVLRRVKLLKSPYSGMEHSEAILASMLLFSVFFISTANVEGMFHAFKTFQNQGQSVFSNTFSKFSQFFLVLLLCEILFGIVSVFVFKLVLGFKNSLKQVEEGNIPISIITGIIALSFALVLQFAAKEMIGYITPQYLNFR